MSGAENDMSGNELPAKTDCATTDLPPLNDKSSTEKSNDKEC